MEGEEREEMEGEKTEVMAEEEEREEMEGGEREEMEGEGEREEMEGERGGAGSARTQAWKRESGCWRAGSRVGMRRRWHCGKSCESGVRRSSGCD
jgi:hypothetical protein